MTVTAKLRGMEPIRLCDIPFDKRMSAARRAARECDDDGEKAAVIFAAMFPSDRVYWIRRVLVADELAAA